MSTQKRARSARPSRDEGVNATADVHIGGDLSPGDDVALRVLSSGRAVLLPRAVRNAAPPQLECLASLQRTAGSLAELQGVLSELVDQARELGLSYASIGWSVGLSGDAVRKRFSDE